jgi:hypothetical protein
MTEAGVKTCRIPGDVLYRPELSLPEKVLLGLVWSFPDGLRLSNSEIGRIVCLHPARVSLMVSRLEKGGWLKITDKQSRWRRIYFCASAKVNSGSTFAQNTSTFALAQTYFCASAKHNRKKKKEGNVPFSVADADVETPSDRNPTQEPRDPEKIRRVLESLAL